MDPHELMRLRDEVLYLHSLWRRGPPQTPIPQNPNPIPHIPIPLQNPNPHIPIPLQNPNPHIPIPPQNPNPNPNPILNTPKPLQPTNPTPFKPELSKKARRRAAKRLAAAASKPAAPDSGVEWPVPAPPAAEPPPLFGWPELKPYTRAPPPPPKSASSIELKQFFAAQVHQKGLKSVEEFFKADADSDGDAEDDDDDDDDEDNESNDSMDGKEAKLFTKIFGDFGDLRGYYEKNCVSGDFYCLVCSGIGKKLGKKFKDGVALVQHSVAISKTKKRRAHRAFANVICKFLGWDIKRLPAPALASKDVNGSVADNANIQNNGSDKGVLGTGVCNNGAVNPEALNQNGVENLKLVPATIGIGIKREQ